MSCLVRKRRAAVGFRKWTYLSKDRSNSSFPCSKRSRLGKDTANYATQDFKEIFGRRESENKGGLSSKDSPDSSQIVSSCTSMDDYFKAKLQKSSCAVDMNVSLETSKEMKARHLEEPEESHEPGDPMEKVTKKKRKHDSDSDAKRKKKKSFKSERESEQIVKKAKKGGKDGKDRKDKKVKEKRKRKSSKEVKPISDDESLGR